MARADFKLLRLLEKPEPYLHSMIDWRLTSYPVNAVLAAHSRATIRIRLVMAELTHPDKRY
jgi:hypothetical protein